LKILKKFQISIYHCHFGSANWIGLWAAKLAMGCDVICYIEKDLEKYLYENCPIINSNILDLEMNIVDLIEKKMYNNKFN
jgi:hypothetical protein